MKSEILDFDTCVMMSLVLLSLAGHHIKDCEMDRTLASKPQSYLVTSSLSDHLADTQNLLFIDSISLSKLNNVSK